MDEKQVPTQEPQLERDINNKQPMSSQNYTTTNLLNYVKTKWGTEDPSIVVAKIGKGDRLATEALGLSPNEKYRSQVVQAGAVDRLLEVLIKTDKPFREVLPPSGLDDQIIPCPSIWLNILNNFCEDGFLQPPSLARDIQYKIIINMGALFQDMSNMETRELFGSRDIWIKSIMFFCNILYSLLSSKFERIGDFLLKQKMLQSFLVRVLYLPMGEPQIVQEIRQFSEQRDDRTPKPDIVGIAATFCACSIKTIWTQRGPKNPTLVETYAGTSITPEHETKLMTGLLPLLQLKSHGDGWYEGGYSAALTLFVILFDKTERLSGPFGVDSASEILVGVSRQHLIQYAPLARDRFFIENILTGLVAIGASLMTPILGGRQAPVDYNVAKAIRAGLLEYFVECCDANDPRVATTLEASIRTISVCVILDDTQKALHELAPTIRAKIERIQDRHPLLLPPLMNLQTVLKNPIIKSPPEDDSCAFCQEKTTPETIEKCPFCKTIVYCSKDCQRLNWMIHQMECASKRKEPVAQTPEQLMADGKKIFGLHVSKMLLQAS
jgi:hypothetical protein